MSKRGGKSKGSGGGAAKQIQSKPLDLISKAQNLDELVDTLIYDCDIPGIDRTSLQNADFNLLRDSCYEMAAVFEEFPQAKSALVSLEASGLGENTYASASYSGEIILNTKFYRNPELYRSTYEHDVSTRHHPKGTEPKHTLAHETGHVLETALVNKYMSGEPSHLKLQARGSRIYSEKVVKEALINLTEGRISGTIKVSKYALKNYSETLAECVADYRANGSKSAPLSREVYKILKRELG